MPCGWRASPPPHCRRDEVAHAPLPPPARAWQFLSNVRFSRKLKESQRLQIARHFRMVTYAPNVIGQLLVAVHSLSLPLCQYVFVYRSPVRSV